MFFVVTLSKSFVVISSLKFVTIFSLWKIIINIIHTFSSLHYFCLINHVTRFIFNTSLTLYFNIKNFYNMFYQKFKFLSRFVMITNLFFASFFDMFSHQTHIILYFKSIDYSTFSSSRKLNSIKKYVNSKFERKLI